MCAALVSLVCFLLGLISSYLYNTPTGASVVVANIVAFLVFAGIEQLRKRGARTQAE